MKTWTKRKASTGAIDAEPDAIVCRPDCISVVAVGVFFGVLMAGATLAILLTKDAPGKIELAAVFSALTLGIAGAVSICLALNWRRELRADASGLYERDRHGRIRFLPWADVDDYFNCQSNVFPGSQPSVHGVVLGRNGERFTFGRGWWEKNAPLANRIKERAVRARAHDWVGFGARSGDDWPRTFHYQTWEHRVFPWVISSVSVGGAIAATVSLCRANIPMIPLMGWGYCLTFTLLPSVLVWGLAVLACIVFFTDWARTRLRQQIALTHDGICFEEGERTIWMDWEAVQEARSVNRGGMASRYLVQSDDESFDFTPRIKDAALLMQAIVYNAPRVREWRLPEDDSVLPTRHVTGSGGFVHHYRTRNNRFGLGMAWIFWAIPLLALLTQLLMQWAIDVPARDNLFPFAWWWSCLLFPLFWLGWRYLSVRVERDGDGLTFYSGRRVRYVLWSQVTDFRLKNLIGKPMDKAVGGIGVGIIDSRVGRFVFFTNIGESERLVRAIEAHVPGRTRVGDESLNER